MSVAKVRVKVPTEPRILEYPVQAEAHPSSRAAYLLQHQQSATTPTDHKKETVMVALSRRTIMLIVGIIVVLVMLLAAIALGRDSDNSAAPSSMNSQDTEAKQLYEKIGKTVLLPVNEIPTVANVSKEELAQQQTGLTDIQENDKVLLFAKSRKAVVYRPSIDKVVAVVTLANPDSTPR